MARLYKCLNERMISGYGSLNGLADEAVPLCGSMGTKPKGGGTKEGGITQRENRRGQDNR